MPKKEFYRHQLPHFQQPGQAYFVTWCLKDSIPPKALHRYTLQLNELKTELTSAKEKKADDTVIEEISQRYRMVRRKYIKAYDDLLDSRSKPEINLSEPRFTEVIRNSLLYFEQVKIKNHAFCIMPNHIHWVFATFARDVDGKPVYVEDILQAVKRFTANSINELLKRKGNLWQKESFDVTIRDAKHMHNAIEYTLNNPVKAGLISKREDWKGNWCCDWVQ